jgi:hypothetical protein
MEFLAGFDFKIEYREGKKNPADPLSRRPDHLKGVDRATTRIEPRAEILARFPEEALERPQINVLSEGRECTVGMYAMLTRRGKKLLEQIHKSTLERALTPDSGGEEIERRENPDRSESCHGQEGSPDQHMDRRDKPRGGPKGKSLARPESPRGGGAGEEPRSKIVEIQVRKFWKSRRKLTDWGQSSQCP